MPKTKADVRISQQIPAPFNLLLGPDVHDHHPRLNWCVIAAVFVQRFEPPEMRESDAARLVIRIWRDDAADSSWALCLLCGNGARAHDRRLSHRFCTLIGA
eukprot:3437052-Rhodomonas_salina.1